MLNSNFQFLMSQRSGLWLTVYPFSLPIPEDPRMHTCGGAASLKIQLYVLYEQLSLRHSPGLVVPHYWCILPLGELIPEEGYAYFVCVLCVVGQKFLKSRTLREWDRREMLAGHTVQTPRMGWGTAREKSQSK